MISVIIVSYNTRDQLRRCLSAVPPSMDIIVVDNNSHDGSPQMVRNEFPNVTLLANQENVGFGAANNQGLAIAEKKLVLYLNSDCYAAPGAIEKLAVFFDDQSIVAAGGKLSNLDGSLQNSSANELTLWAVFCEQFLLEKLFPGSPVFAPYWNTSQFFAQSATVYETPQVMGACLMVRKIEAFDERYFLYCEDTDLCKRLRKHGRIVYHKGAEFVHELGASSLSNRHLSVARYNRGKELYFRFHHGEAAAVVCWLTNRTGALLRLLGWTAISIIKPRHGEKVLLFVRVLFSPITGPDNSPNKRQ